MEDRTDLVMQLVARSGTNFKVRVLEKVYGYSVHLANIGFRFSERSVRWLICEHFEDS